MSRPNILLLHADQQRIDTLCCTGNTDIRTPHLDALAGDGVVYEQSYCAYPVCTPSRYSLLSGLYVHQHLGWGNRCTLAAGVATFPKQLRAAGYRTAAVGKMHFTPTYLDVGFDTMILAEQDGDGRFDDDYHRYLRDHDLLDAIDIIDQRWEYRQQAPADYWQHFGAMESNLPEEHHSTTWIARQALAQIEGWSGDSNLLMVGFIKPHHPFDPPAPWSSMYDPAALSLLPGWTESRPPLDARVRGYFDNDTLTEAELRHTMAMYYATISQIDHQVGRMVELLKQKGLYDNTLIVYTSDHGDYLGFHHMLLKGNFMYEPLARVPLIVKYPAQISAGSRNDSLVSNVDLAPTLLRAAGCDIPDAMSGLPLDGETQRDFVIAEQMMQGGPAYMVRSRNHKYMVSERGDRELLFDLVSDPHELRDLSGDTGAQAQLARHRAALHQWMLYETRTPVYVDLDAPLCRSNVLPPDSDHRQAMEAYSRQKVQEYLQNP